MTFEEWWEKFCKSQGGGYHWQVELMQMEEGFRKAYDAGKEAGYDECYEDNNLGFQSRTT